MTSSEPLDPDLEARVRESFGRQGFLTALGAEMTVAETGRVVLELTPTSAHSQQNGFVHAGVLTTLADAACGYAAFSLMPPGSNVLSVEFKVNLLRPAVGERIIADARVIRAGRTVTVCSCDVYARDATATRQVALLTGTMIRVAEAQEQGNE
jgi:uncharacterized protein (TIGR00369 family)